MKFIWLNNYWKIPLSEIKLTASRSSGPGGQHVNKTNTKITLSWSIVNNQTLPRHVHERLMIKVSKRISEEGNFVMQSDRFRSQKQNRDDCLARFRAILVNAAKIPKARKKTKPSRASKERRLRDKKKRSELKNQRRQ